jgi:thiosulfate/3-mercaptopyruvate sulfurtransferase
MTNRLTLPTPLVSTNWLAEHLGDPDLRVLDDRASGGVRFWQYRVEPAPGGADIIDDLSEPDGGALSKPSRARFAAAAGRLGVGPDSRAVIYAPDVHWATRVWWLLRANGFDNVAVLEGGFRKWTAEGRPTATGVESYPRAEFVAEPRLRHQTLLRRKPLRSGRPMGKMFFNILATFAEFEGVSRR